MINCDVLVCIYFAIVQFVRDHMETIRLAILGVYYRFLVVSDEKQRNQKLAALSISPKIYLFNLVSCLCYALNHVFDG